MSVVNNNKIKLVLLQEEKEDQLFLSSTHILFKNREF